MPRAVIYARFSSDMQCEESIDAQVRACTAYAKSKGYDIIDTYIDEAKSGRDVTKRDAYKQMLDNAQIQKSVGTVVVLWVVILTRPVINLIAIKAA